jgi:feruloyl esterase
MNNHGLRRRLCSLNFLGSTAISLAAFCWSPPAYAAASCDAFAALDQWVQDGKAPAQIIATKYVDDDAAKGIAMQRPLCPYPQKPWYKGTGEAKDAASFTCAASKP